MFEISRMQKIIQQKLWEFAVYLKFTFSYSMWKLHLVILMEKILLT